MTHMPGVPIQGTTGPSEMMPDRTCPKCNVKGSVARRTWESSDGAYEDDKYTCIACGHVWWVEGIDS